MKILNSDGKFFLQIFDVMQEALGSIPGSYPIFFTSSWLSY